MSTYNNSNYLYEFDVRANYYKLEGINAIFRNLLNIKRKYNNKKIIDATFIIVNPKGDKHINKDYYQRVPVYTVEDIVNKNLPIIYKDAKKAPQASEIMKLTAQELFTAGLVDGVIAEGDRCFSDIARMLEKELGILGRMKSKELVNSRYDKFRNIDRGEIK